MSASRSDNAFLLHSQKYTDSKMLLRLLTEQHGVVSAVYRVSKKNKGYLQSFARLSVEWSGSGDLHNVVWLEPDGPGHDLHERNLFCAFYLNELTLRVLREMDSHPVLYRAYAETLHKLSAADPASDMHEIFLRRYELTLLREVGFEISFGRDLNGNPLLETDARYRFVLGEGFSHVVGENEAASDVYLAEDLLAIAGDRWTESSMRAAKRICRAALHPLLGARPLKSRDLFR